VASRQHCEFRNKGFARFERKYNLVNALSEINAAVSNVTKPAASSNLARVSIADLITSGSEFARRRIQHRSQSTPKRDYKRRKTNNSK
jgi:hypothetical protein